MKDFIKYSMNVLGNLVRSDRRCYTGGSEVSITDAYKKKQLALRIESCSQTVTQIKEVLDRNSIRSDIQEHFCTLQSTLENIDIDELDASDVENIESAINRALKAIARFLPDDIFEDYTGKATH